MIPAFGIFFYFLFVLSSVTVGSAVGLVVFLEVVASYAGKEIGAYGSWDSNQWYLAQSKKKTKDDRAVFVVKDCKH